MTQDIVARLERLKAHPEVKSWYRLAKLVEVTQNCVSMWRKNAYSPNQENLAKIVELEREIGLSKEVAKP